MTRDGTLVVVGAGVMGTGIAALAVLHGVSVTVVDTDSAAADRAAAGIAHGVRTAALLGVAPDGPTGSVTTTDLATALSGDPMAVVEAVTEDPAVKADVVRAVSAGVWPGVPLITNTSSIPVDELADAAHRPGDVIGTHFMNPAYLIGMVEVVPGRRTAVATLAATEAVLARVRRTPVVVRDSPGFVTSRLLHPMINDAARLVEEGVAAAAAVDTLMCGCLGHRTGPLRTADLIGIDNLVDSLRFLHARTGDERARPCGLLLAKVRDGHLGRKSGRGFYDYEDTP